MKSLLLILLVASGEVLASPPNCARIQQIAASYEQRMMGKNIVSCNSETLPNINIPDESLKAQVLEKMKCAPLGVMEERARTLENQLTLLAGFQILKNEIRENKEEAAQENLTKAQRAARDFQRSLRIAQSLDLLLNTAGPEPLVRQLKNLPQERRNTPAKLQNEIRQLCSNRQDRERNAQDACSARFSPNDETVSELNTLLAQGSLDDQQLETWRTALQIQKRDGTAWSFSEMYQDLREALPKVQDGRLTLSRNELNAVKNLPDFQDVSALPFMNAIRSARSGMAIHSSLEKFKFTAGDLRSRLETESRSKISWLWKEVKDTGIALEPEQRAACDQAKNDFASARTCWTAVQGKKESVPDNFSDKKALVGKLEDGLAASLSYLDKFGDVDRCLNPEQGATTLSRANTGDELTSCEALNTLNADVEKLQHELLVINGLRERIGSQNQRDMQFRNFAIEKLASLNCASKEMSVVECDESPLNKIAPQAMSLTSDVLDLSIVHVPPSEETNLEQLCEESNARGMEGDLCSFYADPPANPNVEQPAPTETAESPYIEPRNQRNLQREAVLDGLSGITAGIATQLFNRPQNYYNPYANMNPFPYNYNPYSYRPMMSPTDQILFNQRYYGSYGFYFPTLGAAPYTAFPVTSPYVQAGSSSYFGNFGTFGSYQ